MMFAPFPRGSATSVGPSFGDVGSDLSEHPRPVDDHDDRRVVGAHLVSLILIFLYRLKLIPHSQKSASSTGHL